MVPVGCSLAAGLGRSGAERANTVAQEATDPELMFKTLSETSFRGTGSALGLPPVALFADRRALPAMLDAWDDEGHIQVSDTLEPTAGKGYPPPWPALPGIRPFEDVPSSDRRTKRRRPPRIRSGPIELVDAETAQQERGGEGGREKRRRGKEARDVLRCCACGHYRGQRGAARSCHELLGFPELGPGAKAQLTRADSLADRSISSGAAAKG